MRVWATSLGCPLGRAEAARVTMRGPSRPELASPTMSTVLRYSHSFEDVTSPAPGAA